MTSKRRAYLCDPHGSPDHDLLLEAVRHLDPSPSKIHKLAQLTEQNYQESILLIHCGDSEEQCVVACKKVIQMKELKEVPAVLIGFRISELSSVIGRYLQYFEALSTPIDKQEVSSAIERVLRAFYLEKENKKERVSNKASAEEEARAQLTVAMAQEAETVSAELLQELKSLTRSGLELGAKDYLKTHSLEQLEDKNLVPRSPRLKKFLGENFSHLGTWEQTHIVRTSFITSRAFQAFELTDKEKDVLIHSSLFLGESFQERDSELISNDYFRADEKEIRKKFAAKVKDSAL